MRSSRRTMLVTVAGAALMLATTACSGGSDPATVGGTSAAATSPAAASPTATPFAGDSARAVLAKARDAADTATSVHVKGTITEGGETTAINLKLKYGTGAYGIVQIGKDKVSIRRVGKTVYMKAGDAFWKKNAPGSEKLFGGQWIKGSYKGAIFTGFRAFTTKQLVTELLKPDGKLTRTAGKDVGGVATVGLKDTAKTGSGVLYISTAAKAYPLLLESTDKKSGGSITLSEWDQPVTVAAPGGAIDIDKLAGASA